METRTFHRRFRSTVVVSLLSLATLPAPATLSTLSAPAPAPALPTLRTYEPYQGERDWQAVQARAMARYIAQYVAQDIAQDVTHGREVSMTFVETGKTVRGRFLQYWANHGGSVAQGLPISEEMQERSEADGKVYTVQYFERSVFEYHPENQPPYDVLLSLLGVFRYNQKYAARAPEQPAPVAIGARFFPQTGKWLACQVADFWLKYGGVAQFGYPISDVVLERSEVDGKRYSVQYFQRAVLEYHPEGVSVARTVGNVAAAPLGTLHYAGKYSANRLPASVSPQATGEVRCPPTEQASYYGQPPGEGEAPVRSSIGSGHILRGVVRSSKDCSPLAGARIVFTVASSEGGTYEPVSATVFTDGEGQYMFESDIPRPDGAPVVTQASGLSRPPGLASIAAKPFEGQGGITLYASADGYKPVRLAITILCNSTQTVLDLALAPGKP